MKKTLTNLLLITMLVSPVTQAAEHDWTAQSNEYTQILLNVNARYQPELASSLGLEQYDRQVFDLKP